METQKTLQLLTEATKKLNTMLIRQAYLDAIEIGVSLVLFTIALIILSIKVYKRYSKFDFEYKDYGDFIFNNGTVTLPAIITFIVWLVLLFCGGSTIIDCLFNPQYFELKNLLNK